MHTGLYFLHQECASLAKRLRDTLALRECARFLEPSPVDPNVLVYAASTLVAHLAYRASLLDNNVELVSSS